MPNLSIQGGDLTPGRDLTPVTDGSISQPDTPNVKTYFVK